MNKNNLPSENSLELSRMFHEIKNPLTLISSSLQLIENDHPEVKDFRFWEQTRKDLQLLCHLINDLSSFQKSSMLSFQTINLFDFTEDLLESTESFLSEKGTPVILDNNHMDLDFYGDSFLLRQALINLLKNASESSQHGSPIYLRITRSTGKLFISVIDKGCGIRHEQIPYLYEPFHTTKSYGTGLGLSIAKKIIESHHGTLTVFSIPKNGTAFTVSLPLAPSQQSVSCC